MANKHIALALLVAPLLSLIAWFAVGHINREQAAHAIAGQAYVLIAASNCRWPSGQCDLENNDFRVTISADSDTSLLLTSRHALDGVVVSSTSGTEADAQQPISLVREDHTGHRWRWHRAPQTLGGSPIRLVAQVAGTQFYGETGTAFLVDSESTRR